MELGFTQAAKVICRTGESPVYDERRNALYFCDIPDCRIHRLDLADDALVSWRFESSVGSLGLAESGRLVVALRDSVVLFDTETEEKEVVARDIAGRQDTRLNDGKVGPDGAFWVGSISEQPDRPPVGTLFRVTAEGLVEAKIDRLRTSNGLAFSPDGRSMFHADSRGGWIDRWAFRPFDGMISDRHRFADLAEGMGRPDGGATDAEGGYWSAGLGSGHVYRFQSDGNLVASFATPVPNPTMPCFAGPGLSTLFVTSLRRPEEEAANSELAGALFSAHSPVGGSAVTRFRDR